MIDPATDLAAGSAYSITYPAGILRDALGNLSPAVSSTTLLNFSTTGNADTSAPLLTNSNPADNATSAANNRIVLTFNEAVTATTATVASNIVITGITDTRVISVLDATQVTFSGNTISIVPAANLLSSSTYNVQIAAGVIRDTAGNPFAGITTTTALNFTTAPPAPAAAPSLLITELNSNGAGSDFFELFNYGSTPIDLTGWKWDDDSANFADAAVASFPAITLAAGERLIVTNTTEAAFRTAWGLTGVTTVTVVATGGPGLGGGDAVVIFNAAGAVITSFNYRGGLVITASDGTVIPVVQATAGVTATFPNHAGLAFGGAAISSAIWDGVSTTAPRYKAALAGDANVISQPAAPTAFGSPGR